MNLLTKLATLARALVSGSKTSHTVPDRRGQPLSASRAEQEQETPASSETFETLEQTRVADLLRDQLANKEKGEKDEPLDVQ